MNLRLLSTPGRSLGRMIATDIVDDTGGSTPTETLLALLRFQIISTVSLKTVMETIINNGRDVDDHGDQVFQYIIVTFLPIQFSKFVMCVSAVVFCDIFRCESSSYQSKTMRSFPNLLLSVNSNEHSFENTQLRDSSVLFHLR